jgi:hypothetical protein
MSGDLGERISSLEALTGRAALAHEKLADKMDAVLSVTTKISLTQDSIAESLRDMNHSINEHDDRIRSLENTRVAAEASATMLKRMIYAGWTILIAIAGFFGIHIFNTPANPPH